MTARIQMASAAPNLIFPERAARSAWQVDSAFLVLLGIAGFFLVVVIALLTVYSIKYRAGSKADRTDQFQKRWVLEAIWIAIPLAIAFALFVWASAKFVNLQSPPPSARTIYVVGKQWMWKVSHATGQREINELHVPINEPIRIVLSSQDVIHSFYVPAFRIKQDAVPGRFTTTWFEVTKPGSYHLFCAEYCGTDHSQMHGRVIAMPPAQFEQWLSAQSPQGGPVPGTPGALEGQISAQRQGAFYQLGCNSCHLPGAAVRAPRLDGIWGEKTLLRNGAQMTVDEQYVRESILDPNAKIVSGYDAPSLMPTYKGIATEEQVLELVEFIKSLREGWPGEQTGPAPAAERPPVEPAIPRPQVEPPALREQPPKENAP